MSDIRIRVGASLDSSLTTVFRTAQETAKRAYQQMQRAAVEEANVERRVFAQSMRDRMRMRQEAARAEQQMARDASRAEQQRTRDAQRAAEQRVQAEKRALKELEREMERSAREQARITRTAERARAQASAADSRSVRRIGGAVASQARRALGFGVRVAGDIATGAGIDTNLSGIIGKNVGLESAAVQLSNSAYIPGGGGAAERRVDPGELVRQARQIGNETAFDPSQVMGGLQAFTAKTGDLQTGRDVLKDLAVLSKATGTSLEDMVSAAGDVANQLGDIPNKGEAIAHVMATVAREGKLGAVEISDLASQMAKVASSAGQIEGDRAKNITMLTAFAQEARAKGGAASSSQAATSVQGLINTFKTPARIHAFEAATGHKVFNEHGQIRQLDQLVIEALRAKGMDPEGFKKIFANVQGARAVEGFATIYRQAGGGAAGEQAVREEFDRLSKSTMDSTEIQDSFGRQMATTESQVQIFNNQMTALGADLAREVNPALKAFGPILISAAEGLKKMLGLEDQEKDQSNSAAELGAMNAYSQGKGAIRNKQVTSDYFDKSDAAEAALQKAIDDKQAEVTKYREAEMRNNAHGVQKFTEEQLKDAAAQGDTGAEKQLRDMQQLDRMKEELENIHGVNRQLVDLVRSGIVVRVQGSVFPLAAPGKPAAPVNATTGH